VGRLRYLVIALLLIIAAGIAMVVAGGTDPADVAAPPTAEEVLEGEPLGPPAPSLDGAGEGWLNTEGDAPLTDADVEGQVVLYDFWTYSCVNCIRTLPHLRSWYERYHDDGLEIIGVHSPEFDFEKDHDNVARAVEENDITWPVVFDDEMDIWQSFGNQYWPAKYLFGRDGDLRFFHPGEGSYEETEDIIRALLGVDPDSPRADAGPAADVPDPTLQTCSGQQAIAGAEGCQTPETYLGSGRGGIASSSPEELEDGTATFTIPDDQVIHTSALAGEWTVDADSVTAESADSTISMRYSAAEVNLVMAPPSSGPVDVIVELDGEPIPMDARGDAVTEREDGSTVVTVDADDLYGIVLTDDAEVHTLTLTPTEPGLSAFAFTFGS
jgi:thiol-disulfide isomerase/thioredoxin